MAHDFTNLLMVIAGSLELIDKSDQSERRQRLSIRMREAVSRAAPDRTPPRLRPPAAARRSRGGRERPRRHDERRHAAHLGAKHTPRNALGPYSSPVLRGPGADGGGAREPSAQCTRRRAVGRRHHRHDRPATPRAGSAGGGRRRGACGRLRFIDRRRRRRGNAAGGARPCHRTVLHHLGQRTRLRPRVVHCARVRAAVAGPSDAAVAAGPWDQRQAAVPLLGHFGRGTRGSARL